MLRFFQDIADKFKLLPEVYSAGQKAFNASQTAARVEQQLQQRTKPTEPAIGDLSSPQNLFREVKPLQLTLPKKVENGPPVNVLPSLIETGKEMLRAPGRAAGEFVVSAKGGGEFVPGTGVFPSVERFVLGDEPIKGVSATGEDIAKGYGASEGTAKKLGLPLGLAMGALDMLPVTPEKTITEKIAKATDEKVIAKLLTKAKVPGEVVPELSRSLVAITDAKQVEKEIADTVAKQTAERGFVSTVKESPRTPLEVASKVDGQYVPRDTNELAMKARTLIQEDIETAHSVVSAGTDDTAVATAMELVKHYEDLAEKAVSQAEKNVFFDKAAEVANEIAPKLTELGRGVQAAAIYNRMTPAGILRFTSSEIEKYNRTVSPARRVTLKPADVERLVSAAKQRGEIARKATVLGDQIGTAEEAVVKKAQDVLKKLISEKDKAISKELKQYLGAKIQDAKSADALLKKLLVEKDKAISTALKQYLQSKIDDIQGAMKTLDGLMKDKQAAMELSARGTYEVNNLIRSMIPSTLYQKIIAVWKAGLLTGLKTSGLNIMSNAAHAATEVAKDVPAAVVDSVASLLSGKRTKTFTVRGTGSGVKEGFGKGWTYLKTGYDERNMTGKLDYHKVNFGNSKVGKALQTYEESIFKVIGAEDQPFYYGAKARSLRDQALAQAKNAGLKGEARTAFIGDFITNPPDDALKYAVHDAETAVFQNKTALGEAAKAVQKAPGGEVVIPFGKTPGAVATQLINYSPVGIVKTIIQNIGKGKFDQRLFAEGMGRGLTGTGIIAVGAALYQKGMMTLSAPDNERERKQWELEGKKPNSIKIGGTWRSLSAFGPAGNVAIVGGYYQKGLDETGSPTKALFAATAGAGKSVTDQTFLKGLSGALNAVNDPLRYGQSFAENTAGSIVPTIVSDVAQATDPLQREQNSVLDAIEARVPGLRQNLTAKVDVLGGDIKRAEGFLGTMADPFRGSPEKRNTVIQELRRLMDANSPVTPTEIKDKVTIAGKGVSLEPQQVHDLKARVGLRTKDAFEKVIGLSEYSGLSDEKKKNLLERLHQKIEKQEKFKILTAQQRKELVQSLDAKGKEEFVSQLQSVFQ